MTHPFHVPSRRLAREFGSFLDGWDTLPWFGESEARTAASFPALNVWSDDRNLHVEAELPGLGLDEIEITVLGEDLTISGEQADVREDGLRQHRVERSRLSFHRTLRLPHAVDADKVDARLEQGVLTITLPRAEALRPRRIAVQAS
jgi:HSP20 family protein